MLRHGAHGAADKRSAAGATKEQYGALAEVEALRALPPAQGLQARANGDQCKVRIDPQPPLAPVGGPQGGREVQKRGEYGRHCMVIPGAGGKGKGTARG